MSQSTDKDLPDKTEIFMERLTEAQPSLFRFVAAMLPGFAQEVDDIAQDVNLLLIRHAREYDPERPFHAWMLTLARNVVLNFLAKQKRSKVLFSQETVEKSAEWLAEETSAEDSNEPLLRRLSVCREKLKPEQRRLIDLRYTSRLPLERIALEMRLKLSSVHDALVYVRAKLAACMKRLCALDDARFEQLHGDTFSQTLSDFLDSDSPADETVARLVDEVSASEENLGRYLDQMLVHVALSHRFLGRDGLRFPEVRRHVFSRRAALAAACLTLLVGGAWMLTSDDHRLPAAAIDRSRPQSSAIDTRRYPAIPTETNRWQSARIGISRLPPIAALPQDLAKGETSDSGERPRVRESSALAAGTTGGVAAPRKGEIMKAKSIAKAASVAAVAMMSAAVVSAVQTRTEGAVTVESSVGISLDTRANVPLEQSEGVNLEARDHVTQESAKGYNLNAKKFQGFVIMLK